MIPSDFSNKIPSYYGREYDVFNFNQSMIDIRDIAHNLSRENRFCGQTHYPYPVSYHALFVMEIIQMNYDGCDQNLLMLAGLHHDDSEAYMKDLPRYLKHHPGMAFYRKVEAKVQSIINQSIGLPPRIHKHDVVKAADEYALKHELRSLTRRTKIPRRYIQLWHMEPEVLEYYYKKAHYTLMKGKKWHAVLTREWST